MAGPFRRRPSLEAINRGAADTTLHALGIVITEQGEDFLRGTMPVDSRTRQPYGLLHGGCSVVLAETLASLAANLCLEDPAKQQAVGLEINANHLRAVTTGTVTGTARPIHVGRQSPGVGHPHRGRAGASGVRVTTDAGNAREPPGPIRGCSIQRQYARVGCML